MNKKTINKIITAKIIEWTKTITDEKLRKDALESAIVTGGCIASMYMQVPVNDFDIYISNKNVLKRLMEYYTKDKEIEILDINNYEIKKDNFITDKRNGNTDFGNGKHLVILNLDKNQLRFYTGSKGGFEYLKKDSEEQNKKEYKVSFISPNAISLTDNLQIINRFHGNPEEIHKNYDFIHATNYWIYEKGLVINTDALNSILTRTLYYQGSRYPVTSIIRMKKFLKRGFNINAGEIFKMIYQASLLDLNNPQVLEEQLIGIDIAFFSSLIKRLREFNETGEDKLDSTVMFKIIDELFNE